jgi:mycothiol synthase
VTRAIEIRPALVADGPAIVDLANEAEPWLPIRYTLGDLAMTERNLVPGSIDRRLIAVSSDGAIVGHGWLRHETWPMGAYRLELRVHPASQRRGIGSELLEALLGEPFNGPAGGLPEIATFVVEDSEAGLAFVAHHGFMERYRVFGWTIDPTAFDRGSHPTKPLPAGVRLATLQDVDTPALRRALYAMLQSVWSDVPSPDPVAPIEYDEWAQAVFGSDRFDAGLIILALDGGAPVGYCRVEIDGEKAWTHFTGVARRHRGHGIAMHLKLESIRIAAERGVRELGTQNHTGNVGMLAINERLGFQRSTAEIRFGLPLPR